MMRQLGQHQPVLGRPLYPGADIGYESAPDPDPVIDGAQRTEIPGGRCPHRRSDILPPWKRPKCRAENRAMSNAPAPNAAASLTSANVNAPT